MNKLRIALLYGGLSSEREISIKSGTAVERALKSLNLTYRVFDPAEGTEFIKKITEYKPDLAFIALHGKTGEDGIIQGVLEFLGIRYTGSDLKTSAICMDKSLTKDILKSKGIIVPESVTINNPDQIDKINLSYPVVVKPNSEGSSIGVSIVENKDQLEEAVKTVLQLDNKAVIEKYIKGREITVGIINGEPLDIIEIKVKKGFYDYYNKYLSQETRYICPARIEDSLYKYIQNTALKIYNILGCRGVARVDFILAQDKPYFLEVNTIPGLTDHSLIPKAAAVKGIDFENLILKIIKGALNEDG
ncbi:D-alanine--D-alanine ligase [Persephonella sp.]